MPELTKVQTGFLETGVDLDTSTSPLSLSGVQGIKIDKFRIYSFDDDNDKNLGSPTFRHTEDNEDLVFRTIPNGTGTVQFEFFGTDITGSTATNWDNLRFNVNSRGAIVNTSAGSTGTAKDLIFEANSGADSAVNTTNKNQLYISTTGAIGINIDPDDTTNNPAANTTPGSKFKVFNDGTLGSNVNDREIISTFSTEVNNHTSSVNVSSLDLLTRRFATTNGGPDPDYSWTTSEYRLEFHVDNNSNKRTWLSFYPPSTSTSSNAIRFGEQENTEWMRIEDGLLGLGEASPEHLLDLYQYTNTSGSTTGTTLVRLTNNPAASSAVGSDLQQQKTFIDFRFLDDNTNETPQVRIGAEVGENGNADTQLKEGSGAFVVYTNHSDTGEGDADTSLAERLRVDYQGHVGIGVTNPDTLLHLTGDKPKLRIESTNQLTDSIGTEEIGRIEWEAKKSSNNNVAASIRVRQDGTWSTITPWLSPTAIEFYTQDQSGIEETTPRLTIHNSGYVDFRSKNAEYGGISLTHERVATVSAGSFVTGVSYVITTLGDTDWNAAAGTSGVNYALGDSFTAANAGSGTGEADGGSISNINFIDFRNESSMPTGHVFCHQDTDNSSNLRFAVTPASTASSARTTDRRTEALRLLSDRSYSLQHDHYNDDGKVGMIKRGFAEASYFYRITIPEKSLLTLGRHQQYLFTLPLGVSKIRLYTTGSYSEEGVYFEINKVWGSNSLPVIQFRDGAHHAEFDLHFQISGNEQYDVYLNYRYDVNAPSNAVNICSFYITTQAALGDDTTRGAYEKSSPPSLTGGYTEATRIKNGLSIVDTATSQLATVAIGAKHPDDTRLIGKSFITYGSYNEELFSIKRSGADDPFQTNQLELFRVSDDTGEPVMTVNDNGFIRITDPNAMSYGIGSGYRTKGGGILFGSDNDVIGLYRDSSNNLTLRQGLSSPSHLILASAGSVLVSLDVNANDVNTKAFIIGKNSYTSHVGNDWEADVSSPSYQPAVEIARFREAGGLCFNGDSADVNALNDYEEGNYNTTVTASSGITITYNSRLLSYTKIGNLVHVTGRLYFVMGNNVTDAGTAFNFTLPFYAANTSTNASRYETSNVIQVIRATSVQAPGAGARIFRILNGANTVRMETSTGSVTGNFGTDRPHINVNLTYMTNS